MLLQAERVYAPCCFIAAVLYLQHKNYIWNLDSIAMSMHTCKYNYAHVSIPVVHYWRQWHKNAVCTSHVTQMSPMRRDMHYYRLVHNMPHNYATQQRDILRCNCEHCARAATYHAMSCSVACRKDRPDLYPRGMPRSMSRSCRGA